MNAKTILIVDSEENSRDICRTSLEYHGFAVIEATDGEQAVQLVRDRRPDLIVMDLSLPRLNGWSAAECMKMDPQTAHIPIIALTAQCTYADRTRASVSGFSSFLAKPCGPRRILAEVERYLGPHRG